MSAVQIAAGMQAKNLDLLFPGDIIVNDDGSGLSGDYIDFEEEDIVHALENLDDQDVHYFKPTADEDTRFQKIYDCSAVVQDWINEKTDKLIRVSSLTFPI